MTYQTDCTLPEELLEQIAQRGLDVLLRGLDGIRFLRKECCFILNLGAILLLFGLSQLIPFPLRSMLVFFPELGYGLIAVAVLRIGWSVIYTVMYLRTRRSKSDIAIV